MRIIFQTEKGVSVMYPTGALSVEETAKKDVPPEYKYYIVEDEVLPKDIVFNDALEISDGKLFLNVDKAKEIAKNLIDSSQSVDELKSILQGI
jgi:hypothetical protein